MTVKTYGSFLLPERSRMSSRTAGRLESHAKNRHSGRLFLFYPGTTRYTYSYKDLLKKPMNNRVPPRRLKEPCAVTPTGRLYHRAQVPYTSISLQHYQRRRCSQKNRFWQYKFYADIRGGSQDLCKFSLNSMPASLYYVCNEIDVYGTCAR